MKKIVLVYKYNGEDFIIFKEDNKYFACKKVNNAVSFDLSAEEEDMVNKVFDKVKVKEHLKLSNINYNGKEFQHFYDRENNFHTFLNADGKTLNVQDFINLNAKYNNMEEFVYQGGNEPSSNNTFIKRLVKAGKETVLVLMLASALVPSNATISVNAASKSVTASVDDTDYSKLTDSEKIALLKSTLEENSNLNKKEKDFALMTFRALEDNIDIIDMPTVVGRLKKLKINYVNSADPKGLAAGLLSKGYEVTIYNASSIDDVISKTKFGLDTLWHELGHVYQPEYNHTGLYEPLNEILKREYSKDAYTREAYDTTFVKILINMIGSEALRNYNYTGSTKKIEKGLKKIINDEAKIADLLLAMDDYSKSNYDKKNQDKALVNVIEKMDEFYKAKYKDSIYNEPLLIKQLSSYYPTTSSKEGGKTYTNYLEIEEKSSVSYFYKKGENYHGELVLSMNLVTKTTTSEHISETYESHTLNSLNIRNNEKVKNILNTIKKNYSSKTGAKIVNYEDTQEYKDELKKQEEEQKELEKEIKRIEELEKQRKEEEEKKKQEEEQKKKQEEKKKKKEEKKKKKAEEKKKQEEEEAKKKQEEEEAAKKKQEEEQKKQEEKKDNSKDTNKEDKTADKVEGGKVNNSKDYVYSSGNKPVININSSYATKLNNMFKNGTVQYYEYSVIEELDLLSMYVIDNTGLKAYNIDIATGKEAKPIKKLSNYFGVDYSKCAKNTVGIYLFVDEMSNDLCIGAITIDDSGRYRMNAVEMISTKTKGR